MDIYCPACGKKGRIDDAKIPDSGIFARCPGCKKRLWINKVDGVNLAEEPATGVPLPEGQAPASEAPPDTPARTSTQTPPTQTPAPEAPPGPPVPSPPEAVPPGPAGTDSVPAGSPAQPAEPSPTPGPPPSQNPAMGSAPVPQQVPQAPVDPAPAPGFDVSPLPASPVQAGMEPSTEGSGQGIQCNECGSVYPETDMVKFGDTMVCATCKPQYVQRMRTGVAKTGTFTYGGFWIRFIAKFIDWVVMAIVQGIVITPLMILLFRSATTSPDNISFAGIGTAYILTNLISLALAATYTTVFIGKYQATPGKMAFGLKVVAPDGGKISYMRALGRHFAEMVSAFTLLIGYIMAGFDSQKRSLHDRICATRVIRK